MHGPLGGLGLYASSETPEQFVVLVVRRYQQHMLDGMPAHLVFVSQARDALSDAAVVTLAWIVVEHEVLKIQMDRASQK